MLGDAALALFPDGAAVEAARLRMPQGADDVAAGLLLAWALRQSDSAQALALTQTLRRTLSLRPHDPLTEAMSARLDLLDAEIDMLQGRLEPARRKLDTLPARFEALGDGVGMSDCWLLHSQLAEEGGEDDAELPALAAALAAAQRAGDADRALSLEADMARRHAFLDNTEAERRWAGLERLELADLSDTAAAALADYRGVMCALRADYAGCIRWFELAFELSSRSGQMRRAARAASNMGFNYGNMNQHEAALEWLQRALVIAREAGWAMRVGACLIHVGGVLRLLGQHGSAREVLQEAMRELQGLPMGRNQVRALIALANVELDEGQPAAALQACERLASSASSESADLRVISGIVRARALLEVGRAADARDEIELVLQLARRQRNRNCEIDAIAVLADVEQALAPDGEQALATYEQALALAAGLPAYRPNAGLLEAAARAHAGRGNFERAYALGRQASAVRQRNFSEETTQRMAGLRAHHQIETTRAENEHLRRVAELEAARYELLKHNHELMLDLSTVGQEVTTALDMDSVFTVLERHVHGMLNVRSLAIYLLDEAGEQLECAFGMEAGERFSDPPLALDDPHSYSARVAREQCEIVLSRDGDLNPDSHVEGTTPLRSVMFMPLRVNARVVGVMTVQAAEAGAYGEREQLIFRMLCTYGAIALENARAYQRLAALQQHLMQQEKHAALGSMVAGVAHELNTPIGNSLLVATTLLAATRALDAQMRAQQPMRRSELMRYLEHTHDGLQVIEHSMGTAGGLVRSFKQVAVDRSSELRRPFDLAEVCEQCAQTLGVALRHAGVQLQLDVDADLQMDSYPGVLGQVLVILVNNAMLHAFEGRQGGRIVLRGRAFGPAQIVLEVQDDGAGMPAAVQRRAWEPFFTTKFGQGGSGLGLSIARSQIEALLGGHIALSSEVGRGTTFRLELPRHSA